MNALLKPSDLKARVDGDPADDIAALAAALTEARTARPRYRFHWARFFALIVAPTLAWIAIVALIRGVLS